jgi:probable HAF family extracellular repeat protein
VRAAAGAPKFRATIEICTFRRMLYETARKAFPRSRPKLCTLPSGWIRGRICGDLVRWVPGGWDDAPWETNLFLWLLCLMAPLAVAQTIPNADVTYTTIDVPGAFFTAVQGINTAGDMVGYIADSEVGPTHGFLLHDGTFTIFDYPGADSTRASRINDSGVIVGCAMKGDSLEIGFTYDGTTFAPIRVPGKNATVASGINNRGTIVGGDGSLGTTRGFELSGRRIRDISPPGNHTYVYGTGVNNFGQVVGWTASGLNGRGFIYQQGQFQSVAVPGAIQTEAWGNNDSGVIVGWYQGHQSFFGFALFNGTFVTVTYPGARDTFAEGINAFGQVVGGYTDSSNVGHGFLTSPVTGSR